MSSVEDYLRGYNEGYKAGHLDGSRKGRWSYDLTASGAVPANGDIEPVETGDTEAAGSEVLT